jgi:hypothetical protein
MWWAHNNNCHLANLRGVVVRKKLSIVVIFMSIGTSFPTRRKWQKKQNKTDVTKKQREQNGRENEPLEVRKPCKKFEIRGHGEPNLGLFSNFNFPNLGERFGTNMYLPKFYLFIFLLFIFHPYFSPFGEEVVWMFFFQRFGTRCI